MTTSNHFRKNSAEFTEFDRISLPSRLRCLGHDFGRLFQSWPGFRRHHWDSRRTGPDLPQRLRHETIVIAMALLLLAAAIPFAIVDTIEKGRVYLFSWQFQAEACTQEWQQSWVHFRSSGSTTAY